MAVRSLARSGVGTGGKYISFLAGNTAYSPDADELIQEQILGTAASSVTFSSIPQTYKHLQVRFAAKTATSGYTVYLRFNGDTTTNYGAHWLYGWNSAVRSVGGGGASYIGLQGMDAGTDTTYPSSGIVDVLDYTSTNKNKTTRTFAGIVTTGATTSEVSLNSGFWLSTSAITSLTVGCAVNFAVGTRVSLYGSNG